MLNPQIIGVPPNCGAVARNESPLQSPTEEAEAKFKDSKND